jgi:hypothetical protein
MKYRLGVPPAVLRFYTVRSQVLGWFWLQVDGLLRNVRFMACYHGVQCGMHAMILLDGTASPREAYSYRGVDS